MHLNDEERAMLAGAFGEPRRLALDLQIRIGRVFDAPDFVEVSQAHVMGDTESLGEAGIEYLESLANHNEADRRVRVPTITDPRGIDFCAYRAAAAEGRLGGAGATRHRRHARSSAS